MFDEVTVQILGTDNMPPLNESIFIVVVEKKKEEVLYWNLAPIIAQP